jgi:hypothetical protein
MHSRKLVRCSLAQEKWTDLAMPDLGKAANFPYATINPEEARIPVPDARFEWLCETYKPVSRVPAFLTCIDIAGLTAVRHSSFLYFIRLYCIRVLQRELVSETHSYLMSVP